MFKPDPVGTFESMQSIPVPEGGTDILEDKITFVIVDGTDGNVFRGEGVQREDGLRKQIEVRTAGPNFEGVWKDVDADDQIIRSGDIRFALDGNDKFAGIWHDFATAEAGQGLEKPRGTWLLTKAIGSTAVS